MSDISIQALLNKHGIPENVSNQRILRLLNQIDTVMERLTKEQKEKHPIVEKHRDLVAIAQDRQLIPL